MGQEKDLKTYRKDRLLLEVENIYSRAVMIQTVAKALVQDSAEILSVLRVLKEIEEKKD